MLIGAKINKEITQRRKAGSNMWAYRLMYGITILDMHKLTGLPMEEIQEIELGERRPKNWVCAAYHIAAFNSRMEGRMKKLDRSTRTRWRVSRS